MILFVFPGNGPLHYMGLILFVLQLVPFLSTQINISGSYLLGTAAGAVAATIAFGWYNGSVGRFYQAAPARTTEAWEYVQTTLGIDTGRGVLLWLLGQAMFLAILSWRLESLRDGVYVYIHLAAAFFICKVSGRRGGRREHEQETKSKRISEIVEIVQGMPIEEFVPEEDIITAECSVAQLKHMLEVRGQSSLPETCVERQDLVDAVTDCRNYSDTCCICCEEYIKGDPLRILPKCRHEFHVECVDQWAYTFANKTKRAREPSCPLCNTALE